MRKVCQKLDLLQQSQPSCECEGNILERNWKHYSREHMNDKAKRPFCWYGEWFRGLDRKVNNPQHSLTTATAKSLQSCPTLWDPIEGGPPGSPIPGILQAIILEWVAISFSGTTEQVSLNKWSPSPPFVRTEIRYGRDLQTEEAKINKEEGTSLEVTGVTD